MFKLLEINADLKVVPTVEALSMYPYEEIWARDESPNKKLAYKELGYIAFMCDPRDENVFYDYDLKSGERQNEIIKNNFKDYPDWEPDEVILVCLDHYNAELDRASPKKRHYDAGVVAMNKLSQWYHNLDMEERNVKTGLYANKPKDVSDGVKNSEEMIVKLVSLKKKIDEDLFETSKTKANKPINDFER